MASLRTIIAQGRKRIGLLVGAGAPAGMEREDGTLPLIPAVAGLTAQILTAISVSPSLIFYWIRARQYR